MQRAVGAVSRADLLALLTRLEDETAALARMAPLLGFEPRPPAAPALPERVSQALGQPFVQPEPPPQATSTEPVQAKAPLRAPLRDVLSVTPLPQQDAPPQASTSASGSAAPLTLADCLPRQRSGQPPWQALARPLPLAAALKTAVQRPQAAGLDVARLVQALAQAQQPARLPRRVRGRWPQQLRVVLDVSERLQPYQEDFQQLVAQLLALGGGLEVWECRVQDLPPQAWLRGGAAQAQWLILSDLGTLAAQPQLQTHWLQWVRALRAKGADVQVWLPHAGHGLRPAWRGLVPLRVLGAARPGQQVRMPGGGSGSTKAQPHTALLERLLARLLVRASCCVHLDTRLLRMLRLGDAQLRHEPALEALYWAHPQVERSRVSRPLAPPFAPAWRQRLLHSFSPAERLALWRTVYEAHAWRGRSTEVAEALLLHTHASDGLMHEALVQQASQAAVQWLAQFEATALQAATPLGAAAELRAFAADWLGRQWHDTAWQQRHSPALAAVWLASGAQVAPAGLAPQDLHQAQQRAQHAPLEPCTLVERADGLWLWPRAQLAQAKGFELAAAHSVAWGPEVLLGFDAADATTRWQRLSVPTVPWKLVEAASPWPSRMLSAGHEWRLGEVLRPRWAASFYRDAAGLKAGFQAPWGQEHAVPLPVPAQHRWPEGFGLDEYGLFFDLTVKAKRGRAVVQRLRWIEPGSFLMGSEKAEQEAAAQGDKDYLDWMRKESPRHRVTLTQGFWLADTACTQALWLAVVGGKNPSGFTGDDELPVEQVSWDEVMKKFLPKLQALLPEGVEAALPSEAQREYACRAGTSTAYVWGDEVNPQLANIGTGKTTPVKTYPANPWGLFDMHDNVFEWCLDARRTYANAEAVDPLGAVGDGPRALRGGSWFGNAGFARSASRGQYDRGDRDRNIGFRVALRFKPSPGALAQGIGAGSPGVQRPQASQAEPGELRRGRAATPAQPELEPDGREAAAQKNGLLQRLLKKLGFGKSGDK